MTRSQRWLRLLLYFAAAWLLLAALAVLLPTVWMAETHRRLGMGEFPERPLTEYLTRSIAALYAYHGAMMLLLARDVRRFLPMIKLVGYGEALFGATILGIDWYAGMPWFWTALEGPSLIGFGIVVLWLSHREAFPPALFPHPIENESNPSESPSPEYK